MTEQPNCGHDAAAYALGALEPDEARAFRRHLESCAICRDELAAFERVVDALPISAPQHEAPRALRRRVMRAVRAESQHADQRPRRRRFSGLAGTVARPAVAVGLAVAVAVAVVGGVELGSGGSQARLIQARVGDAQLRLAGDHGELIVRRLPPPAAGRIYELWLQRGTSRPSPSTLFSVTSGGTADVGVPGALTGVSRVLVTSEPAGGSRVPTGQPVIIVNPE
jgi:anti-sigma-K factor RskA